MLVNNTYFRLVYLYKKGSVLKPCRLPQVYLTNLGSQSVVIFVVGRFVVDDPGRRRWHWRCEAVVGCVVVGESTWLKRMLDKKYLMLVVLMLWSKREWTGCGIGTG